MHDYIQDFINCLIMKSYIKKYFIIENSKVLKEIEIKVLKNEKFQEEIQIEIENFFKDMKKLKFLI